MPCYWICRAIVAIPLLCWLGIACADKAIGSCEASVSGAVNTSIFAAVTRESAAHESDSGFVAAATNTHWLKAKAESDGVKGTALENAYESESERKPLVVHCGDKDGSFSISAPPGARSAQYPQGAKKYRLVAQGTKAFSENDFIFTLNARIDNKWTVVSPTEPAQLNITRNDKNSISGTFRVVSSEYTITGSFNFVNDDAT